VGHHYGICFMLPFWHLAVWGGSWIFGTFVHPWSMVFSCNVSISNCSVEWWDDEK
jgi:hypothetical protein